MLPVVLASKKEGLETLLIFVGTAITATIIPIKGLILTCEVCCCVVSIDSDGLSQGLHQVLTGAGLTNTESTYAIGQNASTVADTCGAVAGHNVDGIAKILGSDALYNSLKFAASGHGNATGGVVGA